MQAQIVRMDRLLKYLRGMQEMQKKQNVKSKIIYFWMTHIFLRRIGKHYPDFFEKWVHDCVEKPRDRKILIMRYTGDTRMKFSAIAIQLGLDESNLFKYHKRAVEGLISAE